MKNGIRRVLGVSILLGATACLASASSISYYVDVFSGLTTGTLCPGGSPGVAGTCPTNTSATLNTGAASSVVLTLPQFNQSGNANEGTPSVNHIFTLTQVALALDWKLIGNVNIYNFTAGPLNYTLAEAFANMTLTAGGTQVVGQGVASTGPGSVGAAVTPPGFTVVNFTGLPANGSNSQNAANLAFFEGFGSSTYSATANTTAVGVTGFGDPGLAYAGNGQMGAIMSVTYTYTETMVPEPATFALMGGALIGLGALVRRKRNAQR